MLKSYVKTLALAAGLSWASAAGAVGFGDANVNSALGQPLKIEITLNSVSSADRNGMTARLASPDAFKAAGLEYPYHLSRLKFDIINRGGQTIILVTSKEPINDSFINLLVELNWPSGRLVREYTLLLDPPDYQPAQAKAEPVTPIEPVVTTPPVEAPAPVAASAPQAAATEEPVPGTEPVVATPASAPEVTTAPAASGVQEVEATPASAVPSAQPETQATTVEAQATPATPQPQVQEKAHERETITVKNGDTLSKIAAQVKEPDVTLEQMLVAIYRANAKKFDGRNMNRIRAGKILAIPEPEEYEHLSQAAAVKEIRIQTANWQAYRQKLAAGGTTTVEQTPKQQAGGKISTTVAEQAPQPKQQAPGKLVLSQGAAPGDKTVAGGKQAQETAAKDEAAAKAAEAKETEQRIAAQEKIKQDTQKALELKGTAPVPSSAPAAGAASGVRPGSAVAQAKPKLPAPAAPAAEPSFLDDILDNPMVKQVTELDPIYLGGGAAALLVVVGGIIFVIRRRSSSGGGRVPKKKK